MKGDKLGDMVCYGVVNKDLSPQIVLIKLKGGREIERAVGQTILPTHTEESFLTNIECEQLRRFLQQEDSYEGKLFCSACLKRECPDCDLPRGM